MEAESGINTEKFYNIIKNLGAQNIKVDTNTSFLPVEVDKTISFNLGNYYYSAEFQYLPSYRGLPEKDLGLISITISESNGGLAPRPHVVCFSA